MHRVVAPSLVVTAALLVGGCAGGQEGTPTKADAVRTTTVTMPKSYRFDPVAISIDAGDTVTWKNEDNFTHDVTIETGVETGEHTVKPGDEVKIEFEDAGTYDYVCRLHENDMRGTVYVT